MYIRKTGEHYLRSSEHTAKAQKMQRTTTQCLCAFTPLQKTFLIMKDKEGGSNNEWTTKEEQKQYIN